MGLTRTSTHTYTHSVCFSTYHTHTHALPRYKMSFECVRECNHLVWSDGNYCSTTWSSLRLKGFLRWCKNGQSSILVSRITHVSCTYSGSTSQPGTQSSNPIIVKIKHIFLVHSIWVLPTYIEHAEFRILPLG